MRRPVLWANLFLALGILLGQFQDARTVLLFMVLTGVFCVCLFMKFKYWPVFLFLPFAAAGGLGGWNSATDAAAGIEFEYADYGGTVLESGVTASGNQKLTVELDNPIRVEATDILKKTAMQRRSFYGVASRQMMNGLTTGPARVTAVKRLMVYVPPTGEEIPIGADVKFSGAVLPLEKPEEAESYNEFVYLGARKIDAKMFASGVQVLRERGGTGYFNALAFMRGLRDRLANVYAYAMPPREASIMQSILLGDKTALDESAVDLYRASGIYHLLCISGLHIGIFMLIIGRILKLIMPERYAWLVALAVLILYALLTGASVSTVRAVTMGGVFVFSKLIFRDYDLAASTAFACVALLLYEPLYLLDVGFQLSFAAVFGIAFLTEPVQRLVKNGTLASGVAATLATYPILMFHFHEISVYGVLVNLFVIPTASVLVGAGLAVGLAGLFFMPAAVFLAGISYYLLKFYDSVCGFFAVLPFSVAATGNPGLPACVAAYGTLAAFAYAQADFKGARQKKMTLVWVGMLVFAVFMFM